MIKYSKSLNLTSPIVSSRSPSTEASAHEGVCCSDSRAPYELQRKVNYKSAGSFDDRLSAFRLVYESYLGAGLIDANRYRMRVTPYHLQPETGVFIASLDNEVICTVTLIHDSEIGLPIDSVYREEIDMKRAEGLKLAEVSSLAAAPSLSKQEFWQVFMKLTGLMAQSARLQGVHGLVIAAHPKHARFYSRLMGFEQIGELRSYPSVRNRPAVACCLDLRGQMRYGHHAMTRSLAIGSFPCNFAGHRCQQLSVTSSDLRPGFHAHRSQ